MQIISLLFLCFRNIAPLGSVAETAEVVLRYSWDRSVSHGVGGKMEEGRWRRVDGRCYMEEERGLTNYVYASPLFE